jgi:hypothetical protein
MRDIPDNRELTKIGWSVIKIVGLWLLLFLLTKCVAHADVTADLGFNWADGYHDAIYGQTVTDAVTCGWPANISLDVHVGGNDLRT